MQSLIHMLFEYFFNISWERDWARVTIIEFWILFKKLELLLQLWVQKEKHQSWKRGWINLPVTSKFHFLEEIIFYKVYYLGQKPYWSFGVKRGYDLSYFFFISKLQKYCTTSFIWKMAWKIFMWIFYAFFRSFSYRGKVIIKGFRNIIGIGYSITIIKGHYGRYMRCYSF